LRGDRRPRERRSSAESFTETSTAGGRRVDCRWPEHRLTVELDGYRFHNSRYAWEQDRRREREARARDDEFRRYSYADVFEDSAFMLAELRDLLT
jgi:very-short-patch-repair endonuclease